jgi:hypothetical protein
VIAFVDVTSLLLLGAEAVRVRAVRSRIVETVAKVRETARLIQRCAEMFLEERKMERETSVYVSHNSINQDCRRYSESKSRLFSRSVLIG